MLRIFLILLIVFNTSLKGQLFDEDFAITNANQLGLTVHNFGVLGNGYNMIEGEILPSCQYRQNAEYPQEQVEHFADAGIWIGGLVENQARVSTAIMDGVFEPGSEGFEYIGASLAEIRSTDPDSPNFHPNAVSDQDIIMDFKDYGANINDNFGIPEHLPLGIDVHLETYNWNQTYAEGIVILNYVVTNSSTDTINNLHSGIWVNASVVNMNYTSIYEPGGGYTWFDNLDGFDQTYDESGFQRQIGYSYDEDGDAGWAESYIGVDVLGGSVPRSYLGTHYNQWPWNAVSNETYPAYVMPLNDVERYEQLSTNVTEGSGEQFTFEGYPNNPGSWLFMISAGPLGSQIVSSDSSDWMLPPGESLNVMFAILTARWGEGMEDSPSRRATLQNSSDRANAIYHGEDINRNNTLDTGEDVDGDDELDRYILPADPPISLSAVWDYPVVTLTWEPPPQPVVGYNVYKNDSLLTPSPTSDIVFVDNTLVTPGVTAFYLTSVNDWGLESTPSLHIQDYSLPPSVNFVYGSNPWVNDTGDTSFTYPTRTFLWEVHDPEGSETVESICYALDDTSSWVVLPGFDRSITLEDLLPGFHTIFFKAVDNIGVYSTTIQFPDQIDQLTSNYWKVLPVVGDILLVDDFHYDALNNAQNWYRSILDTLEAVGSNNYSVWEIGRVLPYSAIDITATLGYFNHVLWYGAAGGPDVYSDAESSIIDYVMNGGNICLNIGNFTEPTFDWFPIDSVFILNPSGRLFSGTTLISQVDPVLDLQTSSLIARRVSGFETFLGDDLECPQFRSLYRLQEPEGTMDEWEGTPNVCGKYRFQLPSGGCSGDVILMSIPLHSGYQPQLEGNGSAAKLIEYVLDEEFTVGIQDRLITVPYNFHLHQNYPNPFNPTTKISYALPSPSDVLLTVYDITGRQIRILADSRQPAGYSEQRWNGKDQSGNQVSTGMYFCRLQAGTYSQTIKMVYLR